MSSALFGFRHHVFMDSVNMLGGIAELTLRLLAATLIGSAIGLDRELRSKPAGVRTHALVALGAALLVVVSVRLSIVNGHFDGNSVSRVIQGIIAGVGFLGGGAILKSMNHQSEAVHGLTTAASIWVVASLGVACGAGQWIAALIALALALIVLVLGGPAEGLARRIFGRPREMDPERLRITDTPPAAPEDGKQT